MSNRYHPSTLGVASTAWNQDFAMKGLLEVSKELAKVRPESWKNFKEGIRGIGQMMGSQQIMSGIQTPFRQLSSQIGFGLQRAIQPFTNQLSNYVNQIVNKSQPFLQRNQAGMFIGGTAGAILGSFVGHPVAGGALGMYVGAGWEENIIDDYPAGMDPVTYRRYQEQNPSNNAPLESGVDYAIRTGRGRGRAQTPAQRIAYLERGLF